MTTVEAEEIYVRSLANGRVHTKYRIASNPSLASREGCNLDQAEQTEEISFEEAAATSPALLCERDFPDGPATFARDETIDVVPDPDHDDGTIEADDQEV